MPLFSWGERGLVATYFQDVAACDGMVGWNAFLDAINFPLQGRSLIDVWAVVEPDFWNKGFGHPDFVAVLHFDREPTVSSLILEAKMGSYVQASETGRTRSGFNSSINGQIELNHRLSLALSCFGANADVLVEPEWILQCEDYRKTPIADKPRYLKSRIVREQVALAMAGLPLQEYYHVILTGDSDDPRSHISEARRPRIWMSTTENGWCDFQRRFLWTNWTTLYEQTAEWSSAWFRNSYEFMRCGQRPAVDGLPPGRAARGVRLIRLSQEICPRSPPTYLYLSWLRESFNLFDFSGEARQEVFLDLRYSILDLFENIEDEREMPGREDVGSYEWWHPRTLEANRQAWPEQWS